VSDIDEIKRLISQCSEQDKKIIFRCLRANIPIHPIEQQLNTTAEVILEAIARASDLTLRGVRGIIAEASFKQSILNHLFGWDDITPPGDNAFDFEIKDNVGTVRIQVKMQRLKDKKPMCAKDGYKFLSPDKFVVETQRTRGGKDKTTDSDTRPYRFGEFDILAVSMHPSTGDWKDFVYTVERWLLPREGDSNLLLKFQPVPKAPNGEWTNNLLECIKWFRSERRCRIEK
jgi:hypothetical protein